MDLKEYLAQLETLVNIDSGQDAPEGLAAMADFFTRRFEELGWITRRYPLPHTGPCLVCANREADHYDLMLMGHLDTVFPKGTAAARPFTVKGDRAYGPGVCDMKQGSLLIYHVLRELPAAVTDKLNIAVVFNPDEEQGSPHSASISTYMAKQSSYAFFYEPAAPDGARCVQRKGRLTFSLRFTGKEGHCGYVFENDARSAISEMAQWIAALDGMQSKSHGVSVNVGTVTGGAGVNIVPAHASMTVDIRHQDPTDPEQFKTALSYLTVNAKRHGVEPEVLDWNEIPALEPSPAALAYVSRAEEIAKSIGQTFLTRPRGGLSDANLLAPWGPICLDGLGPAGGGAHSGEEYLLLDSILPAFQLSTALISDLAAQKGRD